ncbi:hypothetical protein PR202_gb04598 [Eleusine coracana subsp. coracana]|uniref:Uncharacterized protein n=1 Tax=Eleusine coracana subsp. coracana TaxID=191504 RepID=A0AAV5E450_ELECO|nr:hypothetical protein PR202_gb04598 [Eleusine coracana subsp. coracana]
MWSRGGCAEGKGKKEKVTAEIRRSEDISARVRMGRDMFILMGLSVLGFWLSHGARHGIIFVLDQITGDESGVDAGEDVLYDIAKI